MRALAKTPADRFATTAEFAAAWAAGAEDGAQPMAEPQAKVPSTRPAGRHTRWITVVAAGLVVAIVAVAVWQGWGPFSKRLRGPSTQAPVKKSWILVAEFDGPPEDPSLARAAREIVSAGLDQSPVVGTVPRDQIQLALQQAGKPDTVRLTAQLAREIAYRTTVRTVLEGEIARLGDRFTVTLRAADVEEGKQILTLTDVARSEDALIPVLTRMARRIRERLGENLQALGTTRAYEWSVATPSFEAYRRWAEGIRLYYEQDWAGALQRCRAALAADPDFGVAWATVAFCYLGLGKQDSAVSAEEEALRRPQSLTPAYRLLTEGRVMWLRGDAQKALETFDRVARLYPGSPEAAFALNHESGIFLAQGRLLQALEASDRSLGASPLGVTNMERSGRTQFLIGLGRIPEARREAQAFKGLWRQRADVRLALAEGAWDRAESLATEFERDPRTGVPLLVTSAGARAQVTAVRGAVTVAEAALRRAETLQHEKGLPALAPPLPRTRVLLSLASRRPPPRAEAWLDRDTTSGALITRTYMAAAAGETALARRTLGALRGRTATRLGAHGTTPEFLEASIAAQAGRWSEVVALISGPAREGTDRGGIGPDRVGVTPERWLVAQAYEHLGQPDSAAAFYLRLLGPDTPTRILDSFARQRLILQYARMGRIADAERQLAILERDFTRPDPDVRHLLDDARAAVRAARGMAGPEAQRR